MKLTNNKINKCLCLICFLVCSIFFMSFTTAFAARTDGDVKVVAQITTSPPETIPLSDNNGGNSGTNDETFVPTGTLIFGCAVISLLLLVVSMVIIYLCNKNDKQCKQQAK